MSGFRAEVSVSDLSAMDTTSFTPVRRPPSCSGKKANMSTTSCCHRPNFLTATVHPFCCFCEFCRWSLHHESANLVQKDVQALLWIFRVCWGSFCRFGPNPMEISIRPCDIADLRRAPCLGFSYLFHLMQSPCTASCLCRVALKQLPLSCVSNPHHIMDPENANSCAGMTSINY